MSPTNNSKCYHDKYHQQTPQYHTKPTPGITDCHDNIHYINDFVVHSNEGSILE